MITNFLKRVEGGKPTKTDMNKVKIIISVITIFSIIYALKDPEKLHKIKQDFTNPFFLVMFTIIVIVTIIGINVVKGRFQTSVEHAAIAFITAYLVHLDMVFVVFFIVGIFVYYTDKDLEGYRNIVTSFSPGQSDQLKPEDILKR